MYGIDGYTGGVVFDMDGVIIDTSRLHEESWKRISKYYGFPWDDRIDFNTQVNGTSSVDSARLLFGQHVGNHDISLICLKKSEIYCELLRQDVKSLIVPGFLEFLNIISSWDIPIALATSSTCEEAEFVLKSIDIYDRFNAITCISDVKNPKPHPEIYIKTCEKLGVNSESCLGFEDSMTGIKALNGAGISCIAVGTSLDSDRLESEGLKVRFRIKDFNELLSNFSELEALNYAEPIGV